MTSEEDIVRAFMPCPGQHADDERHDDGVRCTSLDGHHRLSRSTWGWRCSVCDARLRLGVWHPAPEYPSPGAAHTLRDAARIIRWTIERENRQMTSFLQDVLDCLEEEAARFDGSLGSAGAGGPTGSRVHTTGDPHG